MPVTREDVLAAARRDFPESESDAVMRQIDAYGVNPDEPEKARVQLAILKLSQGSMEKLAYFVDAARRDYRDLLFWSENPETAPEAPP